MIGPGAGQPSLRDDRPTWKPRRGRRQRFFPFVLAWSLTACGPEPENAGAEPQPPPIAPVEAVAETTRPRPTPVELAEVRDGAPAPGPTVDRATLPVALRPCAGCHPRETADYARHGMADSVGPVDAGHQPPAAPPEGELHNPRNGLTYLVARDHQGPLLTARRDAGGERRQRLRGRIGAGRLDTSWAAEEIDPISGQPTGRFFFAPVETITDHGNELSPFETGAGAVGLDLALTEACLTCHTDTPLDSLPGASLAVGDDGETRLYPANALGHDAFEHLEPFGCTTCHGDAAQHLAQMTSVDDTTPALDDDPGLRRLAHQDPGAQRDVCARCHLQGDARLDLVGERPDPTRPLAAQVPVLVPREAGDEYRFVSQLERLVLSPCFEGSETMTCTTCHRPHQGVAQQGTASFDAICSACHDGQCVRPPGLEVATVTGGSARTADGCVDCHMRRSQPFDLPHVRSADHFVRRRIPPPRDDIPHRAFADRDGELRIFDDGRLAEVLTTAEGERWRAGVEAVGLLSQGRVAEAQQRFAGFPPPGSGTARKISAPRPLAPLETTVAFHYSRGLALLAGGDVAAAESAWNDALAVDPLAAGVMLSRARLRLDRGDVAGTLVDSETVITRFPRAEQPWELRAALAERVGRPELARTAYDAYTRLWPSNAAAWFKLGLLRRMEGRETDAVQALSRARTLEADLELPGAGRVTDH